MMGQVPNQGLEHVSVTIAEVALLHQVHHLLQQGLPGQDVPGAVAVLTKAFQLRCRIAEEEEIVLAHPITDLQIGAVKGANGEGAVQGEFHVTGAGSLFPRRRNLLGKIRGRIDRLTCSDVVVW